MRRQEDSFLDFSTRAKANQQVGPLGKNRLKLDVKPMPRRGGCQEVSDVFLAGPRMAKRQKSGIDAWQGDQFAEQLFGLGRRDGQSRKAYSFSKGVSRKLGCPAWIRTMTKASKGPCATITPPDKPLPN